LLRSETSAKIFNGGHLENGSHLENFERCVHPFGTPSKPSEVSFGLVKGFESYGLDKILVEEE
jgi:hypothetical protein